MPAPSTSGFRALVLAAGHGTRLRPLTERTPKPLLPVLGRPLIAHTLEALAAAGCEAVAINLHHLAEAIPSALGERWEGMPLVYSREESILGTGGALLPLRGFLAASDPVVVVNGDSLCRWPLRRLLDAHRRAARRGALATVLLAGRPDPGPFGGGVDVAEGHWVRSFRGEPGGTGARQPHVFAGAQALAPALIDRLPPGRSDSIRDLSEPLLAAGGRIAALLTWRPWHDLGTPWRYLEGVLDFARRAGSPVWCAPDARISRRARLHRSVVERGAIVEPGAEVEDSLVLPGATVGAGCVLRQVIVGPEAVLPPRHRFTAAFVTASRSGGSTRRSGAPELLQAIPLAGARAQRRQPSPTGGPHRG